MRVFSGIFVAALWTIVLYPVSLQAQSLTETCEGQPTLGFGDTLGFLDTSTPMSDDFPMSNCMPWDPTICGGLGLDVVVCFTPTNDCEVLVQSATGGLGASVHVFEGSCVQEPVSCVASESNTSNAATIFGIQLTGGVQYCVVAERCGVASVELTINQTGGTDCGPLGDPSIFLDGFESGDTSAWVSTVP